MSNNSDKNEDNNMSNKLLSNDKLENKIKNENYININENSDSEIQILDNISIKIFSDILIFNSIDNILYAIYSGNKSIICYNMIDNKKINEIKNAFNYADIIFKYHLDKKNKKDLILTISCFELNIKLWKINDLECLLNIEKIYEEGFLNSACFLNENNKMYIITSNYNLDYNSEPIKVYDLNGNKIGEINDSKKDGIFCIESYYDNKLSKNYIITCNKGFIKSYDFNENKKYRRYNDNDEDFKRDEQIIIYNNKEMTKLIVSNSDGKIMIWNFHSGSLLSTIKVNNCKLFGILLINEKNIFIGCEDGWIKSVDIENGKFVKNLFLFKKEVLIIKKIIHPKYGQCFLSQNREKNNNNIVIWKI